MDKYIDIKGSGGSNDEPDPPRVAVEDPNNLHSKNTLRFIDMVSEGEIFGLVEGDPSSGQGKKSIYLNEVPLRNSAGEDNYGGVTAIQRVGTTAQSVVPGFSTVESEIGVSAEVTYGNPIPAAISSTDIDDIRFTFTLPQMSDTDVTTGDMKGTTIQLLIEASINGGAYAGIYDTITKTGKCTAPYQFSVRATIPWGAGARTSCDIRVSRLTADADTAYLSNITRWESYTEIINEKLIYPDTAYIAYYVDAEYFGRSAPSRIYDLKGILLQIPNNYDPTTVDADFTTSYSGSWDGTFQTAYSNNPAWVYYDLLTNVRYGLGIDPQYVDKWALYTAAYYCDGEVDDGFGGSERRFTFNGVIENRAEAYHVLNMVSSVFRSMPWWGTGLATVSPDMPIDATRLVTAANVIGGNFEYQGTGLAARHTAAFVTWNDPDDFCQPRVEVVQDAAGIVRYGYNIVEVVAYGCTSRGQANRFGKWMLYTDINQTEIVTYRAGFDHADCVPGEVVKILDPDYAQIRYGGRVVSAVNNVPAEITLDAEVDIDAGEVYTLWTTTSSGTLQSNAVDEGIGGLTDEIILEGIETFDELPDTESVWMLTAVDYLEPRHFRVLSVIEKEPHTYEVNGVFHDPNKFAIVEQGLSFDPAPFTRIPSGKLTPPTALAAEEFTYNDGASNQQFGVLLSWTPSADPRTYFYQTQLRNNLYGEVWHAQGGNVGNGETGDNALDMRPVVSGSYDFRVRAVSPVDSSEWLTLSDFAVYGDPDPLPNVTGLVVVNGDDDDTWNGPDCEITWDTVSGTIYRWKDYVIEVYTIGDSLLRTHQTTEERFTYTYDWNAADNGGTALRNIKFKVYSRDTYDKLSLAPAVLIADNPAPTLVSDTPTLNPLYYGLQADWDTVVDNDMSHYKIYADIFSPPTTEVAEVAHPTSYFNIPDLTASTTYFVKVVPWDLFGEGTASQIASNEPVAVAFDDITGELQQRLIYTDSLATGSGTMEEMYDGVKTSGGVAYTSGDWVKATFPIGQLQNGVSVWASNTIQCYFSSSIDGSTWTFYKAEGDNTLDAAGRLITASNEADAITNYWSADAGDGSVNYALFPNRLVGQYMRLHVLSSSTVYELVFQDQVIAEQILANQLSAITADFGAMTAGTIQSTNWGSGAGQFYDLNNDTIEFGGSSSPKLEWNGGTSTLTIKDHLIAGDATISTTGFIRGGQSAYNTGQGFFMGYSSGAYKFSLGDPAGSHILWDGSNLTVQGGIAADSLTIDTDGFIKTVGKDGYTDDTAGLWVGYDSAYKFYLGDANDYIKWDGSDMFIKGQVTFLSGTTGYANISDADPVSVINAGATTIDGGKITTNSITATQIAASTITSTQIAAGTIVAGDIATNTITATQIAANAITSSELSANAVYAVNIVAGTITADRVFGGVITGTSLARTASYTSYSTSRVQLQSNAYQSQKGGIFRVQAGADFEGSGTGEAQLYIEVNGTQYNMSPVMPYGNVNNGNSTQYDGTTLTTSFATSQGVTYTITLDGDVPGAFGNIRWTNRYIHVTEMAFLRG